MGASISFSSAERATSVITEQVQKCGVSSCTNISEGNTITIDGSNVGDLDLSQRCQVDTQCVSNNLASTLADNINKLTNEAKGALGFGISIGKTMTTQDILNKQLQDCGVANAENIKRFNTILIKGSRVGKFNYSQVGDASTDCVFKGLSDTIVKSQDSISGKSSGFDPTMLLASLTGLPAIIAMVVILILIILLK
jgi:hypothetical protein